MKRASWTIRRRIVVITLCWCGAMVSYLSVWGRPISLSETAVNGCLLLMASVIGSYVFGAVWDDKNQSSIGGTTEVYQRVTTADPGPAMPEPPEDGK